MQLDEPRAPPVATPEKREPRFRGAHGRLLACLWRSVSLFLFLSRAVFVEPLGTGGASAVPDESDAPRRVEQAGRGPGRRKIGLWAICHVVGTTPAVKIFDTGSGRSRDISRGVA